MAKGIGKKASNVFVWIILGLLMFALAGFGVTSFTGGSSQIGRVGTAEITAEEYFRALEQELRSRSIQTGAPARLADLQVDGVDAAIRNSLIARAALLNEANEMGVSVGDETIAEEIRNDPNFQAADGFNREAYIATIGRVGLSPREYEATIRADTTRALLQFAVISGISAPAVVADTLTARETERRDFTIAIVDAEQLTVSVPEPTDAELQSFYDANGDLFERPEVRRISYAWLTPEMILDDVPVDDADVQRLYDARIAEYIRPDRRLVERLVFPDAEAADAARAALDAGEADFDALVEARGLSLEDVDLGVVTQDDLTEAAAEAVFAEGADIVGPIDSAFGPALFRINGVLDATEVTLDEAESDLRAELASDGAVRLIAEERQPIEDALAGGAEVEELAEDTLMELGQIDFDPSSDDGIALYDGFREAASLAAVGDFPEALPLADGGLFALRLDEIVPPSIPPLDEIEDEVREAVAAQALREALESRALDLVSEIALSGATLEELGLELLPQTGIGRQDFVPDMPFGVVPQIYDFELAGELAVLPADDRALILRLDAIQSGNINDVQVAAIREFVQDSADGSFAQDIFEGFGQAMEAEVGLTLNNQVINAVHANFP